MVWEDRKKRDVPVWHPNRQLPESQLARMATTALMILTIAILVIVAIGGWSTLVGAKAVHVGLILVYCIFTWYVINWNRGVLPVISATAIILGIFALVSGPHWFARDKTGFTEPALPDSVLGVLTLSLIPLQMLLVVVAMWGFLQKWNVEEEVKDDVRTGTNPAPPTAPPSAAAAS
jgi:TRAP-type uncharacterized transport system fused permease subunit